jgi:hypothetical protein
MESKPLQSPICAELRSKKYFFLQSAPMQSSDVVDNSNDCWCNRTCDRVGPDGDGVHPDECRAERSCFRSIFARPESGVV